MTAKKKTKKSESTETQSDAKTNELVNFVANNMLNNITLNQCVQLVQQVVVRDAETLVTKAEGDKLKEIEDAYFASIQASQQSASQKEPVQEDAVEETEEPELAGA